MPLIISTQLMAGSAPAPMTFAGLFFDIIPPDRVNERDYVKKSGSGEKSEDETEIGEQSGANTGSILEAFDGS